MGNQRKNFMDFGGEGGGQKEIPWTLKRLSWGNWSNKTRVTKNCGTKTEYFLRF